MRQLKAFITKDNLYKISIDEVLKEIPNFTYKDAITPGNIIEITCDGKIHHGIVLSEEQTKRILLFYVKSIATLTTDERVTHWSIDALDRFFPNLSKSVYITKVYKSISETKAIKDKYDIKEIYKKYKLIPIQL